MPEHTVDDLSEWLTQSLLPGWITRVYDPSRAGFVEVLESDGAASASERRTTLVTARLIYVFSHAHLLGVPRALDAARHGLAFLLGPGRSSEGGFVHACAIDGRVIDDRRDLYDLAFVLFALGWFFKASGEHQALVEAEALMGFIETALHHPHGGFREDDRGALPRRQNPHMHLLEACHALADASGDAVWLERADRLVRLMQEHMLDQATGSLGEFFGEDWRAWPGPRGLVREPGHHFEWVWLLHHHHRLTGSAGARQTALQLYSFAAQHHGTGAVHPVINENDAQGGVIDGAALLWPQTEYLKALVARIEFEHDGAAAGLLKGHLALVFERFVDRRSGLWVNQIDAEGEPIAQPIPVRVLYHLMLALAEIIRTGRA